MSSISTCRIMPRTTSIASAAPAAPGKPGRAFTLATPEDGKAVAAIEALIRKAIPREKLGDMPAQELSLEEGDSRRRGGRGGRGGRGREGRGGEREQRAPRSERPREHAPRREEHRAQPEIREPAAPRLAASRPVRRRTACTTRPR